MPLKQRNKTILSRHSSQQVHHFSTLIFLFLKVTEIKFISSYATLQLTMYKRIRKYLRTFTYQILIHFIHTIYVNVAISEDLFISAPNLKFIVPSKN